MTTARQRKPATVCSAIVALILLLGCGGKTVSNATSQGHVGDGGSGGSGSGGTAGAIAGTGGTSARAGSGGEEKGGEGGLAGSAGAEQAGMAGMAGAPPDAGACVIAPWDHKCYCKTWTDDAYLPVFFSERSCVLGGQWACPPDYVCCARSCLSSDICLFTGSTHCGFHDLDPCIAQECCSVIGPDPTMCVRPEQCAPEGVLVVRPQTPKDVVDKNCWY